MVSVDWVPWMTEPSTPATSPLASMPCILLDRGKVFRAGPRGPEPVLARHERPVDLFDVIDGIAAQYRMLYLVDLGALEGHDPQLDYIQEVSRDIGLWVDAGVRTAEQAIDVIVAGAQKATISGSRIRGPNELRRAWELSANLIFEVEIWDGTMTPVDPLWGTKDPAQLSLDARALGPTEVILSLRGVNPDWELAARIAHGGPTWIAGSVSVADAPKIVGAGAAGAIYPLGNELRAWADAADGPH